PAVRAQESRLVGRLPDATRTQVEGILEAARAAGLPTEPLVDRVLEGAAKRAPADRIMAAITRLRDELRVTREAFGETATTAELTAGASALRAGATRQDLARLHSLRPGQKLTVAAGVLADLVAAGVPADTGIAAVLALAPNARDADYVAFRRNVERDIALGASPAASIGARLLAAADFTEAMNSVPGSTNSPLRKRKP
ncbi:MAG: hypothetical protein ACRENP_30475, partial [Longimicrobiales bacterium]